MHHKMLDHFAGRDSAVHRLDPVAKVLATVAVVLATVLVGRDRFAALGPVAVALGVFHALGRVPVGYTLRRLAIVSPFALALAVTFPFFEAGRTVWAIPVGPWWTLRVTDAGLLRAANLLAKFLLCFWATMLLVATTRFQDVVGALGRLRVPRAMVAQLGFLYRYLWVMIDEMMRMRRAREARDGGRGTWGLGLRSRAGLVGVLFLRSYGRAERIYWAMAARGFDGTIPRVGRRRMRAVDWVVLGGVVLGAAGVVVMDRVMRG